MSSKLVWVDPPSGWQYGFPKLYTREVDGDMSEWMVQQGYPEELMDVAKLGTRMWSADSEG